MLSFVRGNLFEEKRIVETKWPGWMEGVQRRVLIDEFRTGVTTRGKDATCCSTGGDDAA